MPAPRNRQHLTVPTGPLREDYTPPPRKMDAKNHLQVPDRPRHGARLMASLQRAQEQGRERREHAGVSVRGATDGLYVVFDGRSDLVLEAKSLEAKNRGIELVSVRKIERDGNEIDEAVVFVPDSKIGHFLNRFEKYSGEPVEGKEKPPHSKLVDSISSLRLAAFEELWTDDREAYPGAGEVIWWEVWLRRAADGSELARFYDFAGQQKIRVSDQRLAFDDRLVLLVEAAPEQLAVSLDVLSDIAELRRAKEAPGFFVDELSPTEQVEWSADLIARTTVAPDTASAVTILDTGVTSGHPLLTASLDTADCHSYQPAWGTDDSDGHGTEMAGLALYGSLLDALQGAHPIQLHHRLESVKVLPPTRENPPQLYGAITAEAASRVEIAAPHRSRCFSMAIAAEDQRDRGRPTSWSAAIDALAVGRSFDQNTKGLIYLEGEDPVQRLFVLAAGNVSELEPDHLTRSDVEVIHDPGQAWNALTVGACTELATINDPQFAGLTPVAKHGELSPWSTTSVAFSPTWPIKPDVVFEGGNPADDGAGFLGSVPDMSLLTTHHKPGERLFNLSWATSAATAQVARIAATISSAYPEWWPETVRGMVVHSAEWTARMRANIEGARARRDKLSLVRRYGHGVPSLDRSLRSADDALTLVVQSVIEPFKDGAMSTMNVHALPWPRAELEALADTPVTLRVTLSYFVEPNPARRGWKNRYCYQSHGLRFDVIRPTESADRYRKRLNKLARAEGEKGPDAPNDDLWLLGANSRTSGSIHSDTWSGLARDLADRGMIAVYPVAGWWKDDKKRDRSQAGARYSLIASITTEAQDVDIWTPVATEIGVPVEIVGEW